MHRILSTSEAVVLDFDGPVCSVYGAVDTAEVTKVMAAEVRRHGLELSDPVPDSRDPIEWLRWAGGYPQGLQLALDAVVTDAECRGVDQAAPTAGVVALVQQLAQAAIPLAIVSNNSRLAIVRFLEVHFGQLEFVPVHGRVPGHPQLLKPNPSGVLAALSEVGASAASSVLIGDSLTDLEVAQSVGMRAVAFANKPRKMAGFLAASPDLVVGRLDELIS